MQITVTQAKTLDFIEFLTTDGGIAARNYALVSPRVNGIIDEIRVREGDQVKAGVTILFQIDNKKLRQSVELQSQALVIARSTKDESQANLENAAVQLSQAEKDFARIEKLYQQKVITLSDYEQAGTRVTQLQAMHRLSATQVTVAEQSAAQVEINLEMAKQDLADSIMLSPIDGVVSARYSEPGEMGSSGNSILRIDDVTNLKAVAYLPGEFYPRVNPQKSMVRLTAMGKNLGEFPVTYKSPAIDASLHTFEIWANLTGDGAYAVPGAQAVISVILNRSTGIGIPRDAIQFRNGRYWVFIPDGEVAKMVEVKQGIEMDGWVELLDSDFLPGQKVVTQGQYLLDDGYPIRERAATTEG
jgi:HlyD family secretion protein